MNQQSRALSESEEQVLIAAKPDLLPIATALRDAILAVHPDATIAAWPKQHIISFGLGTHKMSEHYALIALHLASWLGPFHTHVSEALVR